MVAAERRAPEVRLRSRAVAPSTTGEVLGLAALVAAFRRPIAAIVLGHVALARTRRSGGAGSGPAFAGLLIGYLSVGVVVLVLLALLLLVGLLTATVVAASATLPSVG